MEQVRLFGTGCVLLSSPGLPTFGMSSTMAASPAATALVSLPVFASAFVFNQLLIFNLPRLGAEIFLFSAKVKFYKRRNIHCL
jgi:hypothetical protein